MVLIANYDIDNQTDSGVVWDYNSLAYRYFSKGCEKNKEVWVAQHVFYSGAFKILRCNLVYDFFLPPPVLGSALGANTSKLGLAADPLLPSDL